MLHQAMTNLLLLHHFHLVLHIQRKKIHYLIISYLKINHLNNFTYSYVVSFSIIQREADQQCPVRQYF